MGGICCSAGSSAPVVPQEQPVTPVPPKQKTMPTQSQSPHPPPASAAAEGEADFVTNDYWPSSRAGSSTLHGNDAFLSPTNNDCISADGVYRNVVGSPSMADHFASRSASTIQSAPAAVEHTPR